MLDIFIKRPVLASMISVLIMLLGILSLLKLPITQFPSIEPPSVTVTANYTGANAEVCAKTVATPLERAINGVPGMTSISSVCSNNGMTLITIFFESGTDPDLATVNVQNRVTSVLDELPEEVIKAGVITEKEVNSMLMYLNITSTDSLQDEKFVYNFADINILQELKRINGVGYVEIMGARDYAMRVWLKPDRMASYGISAQDVIKAVQEQNIEAAPGATGISSDKEPQLLQYVLRYTGKFTSEAQYADIVVKSTPDGSMLRIKDIADVEFGSLDYDMISTTDGRPSASIMIKQRPGSNARQVIQDIKDKMAQLQEGSFPPAMAYSIAYDVSRFLDTSIHEVIRTLVEAFVLVSLVVFIFLQDFRSTLIPAVAVPVSLIGTFFFMDLLGFSINLLTLFALVLAIGIVVDNAIVVVEAVHVKMHKEKIGPKEATFAAMKEISGAIIGITLVMSAVFIPVGFMSGPVGVFYRQFSLTLAIAIFISGLNALTLSPALCAILLKPSHDDVTQSTGLLKTFFYWFNRGYGTLEEKYHTGLAAFASRKIAICGLLALFMLGTFAMSRILPTAFIPTEDQGMIYVNVTLPAGATVERTQRVLEQLQQITQSEKSVESVSTLAGYSLLTESASASFGMAMINMKGWSERSTSVNGLIATLQKKSSALHGAEVQFFPPPAIPGFGNASGFELRMQDRTGGPLLRTAEMTNTFVEALNKRPEIENTFTNFDPNFPQYMLSIDYDKAKQLGVSVKNAMDALQTLIGSFYASNFIRYGQMYKVMVQTEPGFRTKPSDILKLYVKSDYGEMVPYSTFMTLERTFGPEQLTRYNMFTSSMINGEPAAGYSSGDAIAAVQAVAEELPRGYSFDWTGISREEIKSGNQTFMIFAICLLFVYILLAAQYESYLLPFPILLSLPAGIFGTYFFLKIVGLENNIYAQVALVMLIGLLGKNAILIVEFALQRRREGYSPLAATIEGAAARLRPILMTSLAFVVGLIPLCIASGAGAIGNRSIGTAAAGGMIVGTLGGIILVPGLFYIFELMRTPKDDDTAIIQTELNDH